MTNQESHLSVMKALGEQVAAYRLRQNITQLEMANEAGVSRKTIMRLENGQSIQLDNFLRILGAMSLLDNVKQIIPAVSISPMQQLKLRGKERERASSAKKNVRTTNGDEQWFWKDDE